MTTRMHCLSALLAAMIPAAAIHAQDAARNKPPTAWEDITFAVDFDDESTRADMANGSPSPAGTNGTPAFAEGIRGKALLCGEGGTKLVYKMTDNIDFDKPGSVSFWFHPEKWDTRANEPRVFFFGFENMKGFLGFQVDNSPKIAPHDRQLTLLLMYFKEIPTTVLYLPPIGAEGADKWHLVVIAWSQDTIYVSVDGKPYASKKLAAALSNELFPLKTFSIGAFSSHQYRLDEFKAYRRKLDEREIAEMWGMALAQNFEQNKGKE